jgi:hypothetical protein
MSEAEHLTVSIHLRVSPLLAARFYFCGRLGAFEPPARVKDMEENGPDHGDPEYRGRIERLVSQFREWRSQPRQKPKDIYSR